MTSFALHIAICVCCLSPSLGVAHNPCAGPCDAAEIASPDPVLVQPVTQTQRPAYSTSFRQRHKLGFGIKASLLGGGFEVASAITTRTNLRAGFNMFRYDRSFQDGINYDGKLSFKTVEMHYDIFPWAGRFHISPGMLIYIGTPITAIAGVPGGQSFSLEGNTIYSDPAAPISGRGKITFNRTAPMITFGWGNLIPRSEHRHFSVPFELGIAYQGSPKAAFNLTGNFCDSPGVNCRRIAADSDVQSGLQSEQSKLNHSVSFFKVYPIISIGFGYKF